VTESEQSLIDQDSVTKNA